MSEIQGKRGQVIVIDDLSLFNTLALDPIHQAKFKALFDDLEQIHAKGQSIRRTARIPDIEALIDPIEAMEKWLKTLEPMRPDIRAYERVKGSTGMKPKAINQSRPVGRPMRSVNRNR